MWARAQAAQQLTARLADHILVLERELGDREEELAHMGTRLDQLGRELTKHEERERDREREFELLRERAERADAHGTTTWSTTPSAAAAATAAAAAATAAAAALRVGTVPAQPHGCPCSSTSLFPHRGDG